VDPRSLVRRDVNARYMEPAQFMRLVQNFKTDGKMTGTVTVCQNMDGGLEILSGHHRTEAAIEAGFEAVDVVVITTPLSEDRKTAIQLSHNSITGQDNPNVLAKMYESLDLEAKKFSGLTDAVLDGLKGLSAANLTALKTGYEEMTIVFLPETREELDGHMKRLREIVKRRPALAARYADFDAVFEAIVAVKSSLKILNDALAIAAMARLAVEKLDEEAETAQEPI
jgi:hypothetical protein